MSKFMTFLNNLSTHVASDDLEIFKLLTDIGLEEAERCDASLSFFAWLMEDEENPLSEDNLIVLIDLFTNFRRIDLANRVREYVNIKKGIAGTDLVGLQSAAEYVGSAGERIPWKHTTGTKLYSTPSVKLTLIPASEVKNIK